MKNLKYGMAIGFVLLVYLLWCFQMNLSFILAGYNISHEFGDWTSVAATLVVLLPLLFLQIWAPYHLVANLMRIK